jgi:hypothetical protein
VTGRLDNLRKLLAELEDELDRVEELDDATRDRLTKVRGEIQESLDREEHPSDWQPEAIVERLTEATYEFSASHPTLSGIVRRLVDALGQMGI